VRVYLPGGAAVRLDRGDFVGQGGQGRVYARGDRAFKVYADPAHVVPPGKMRELAAVRDDDVLKPLESLVDRKGTVVGHTMRFVPDTEVLCTLFARTFREQHGVTPEVALALVRRLRRMVGAAHAASCLIVDLNEMNFLVSRDWKRLFAIDVDSWQTPQFAATALMESVRDRHSPKGRFSPDTDWFAFAITSFQLLRGIHPYKGAHPTIKGLDARMQANVSVLNPAVTLPRVVYPADVVPEVLNRWYDAVFERGLREPPPSAMAGVARLVSPAVVSVGGDALDVVPLGDFAAPVRGWFHHRGTTVVLAGAEAIVDGRPQPAPIRASAVGFTAQRNRPVLAWIEGGRVRLLNLLDRREVAIDLAGARVIAARGRLYVHSGPRIVELGFVEAAQLIPAPSVVAHVLEHATRLHQGCALQDVMGSAWVSAFAAPGVAHQLKLPELDGARVVHARYDRGVLMVVAVVGGAWKRFVFRFPTDHRTYDLRIVDSEPRAPDFVTLDSGVCVALDEAEQLEVFFAEPGSADLRRVVDRALGGDMHLHDGGGTLVFTRGRAAGRLAVR
jgi:hypothetical protein